MKPIDIALVLSISLLISINAVVGYVLTFEDTMLGGILPFLLITTTPVLALFVGKRPFR